MGWWLWMINMEGCKGLDTVHASICAETGEDKEKHLTAGLRTENRYWDFQSAKQDCSQLNCDIMSCYLTHFPMGRFWVLWRLRKVWVGKALRMILCHKYFGKPPTLFLIGGSVWRNGRIQRHSSFCTGYSLHKKKYLDYLFHVIMIEKLTSFLRNLCWK
jgi:hypothetical protein